MARIIFLCILLTFFGALGGYYFKKAASGNGGILRIAISPYLYIGGMFYVLGAVLNIIALKELKYTIMLPLTSITYVWTIAISYLALKEKITGKKLIGVGLIIFGASLLATM